METSKTQSSHGESTLNLPKMLGCFGCSCVSLCAIDIRDVFSRGCLSRTDVRVDMPAPTSAGRYSLVAGMTATLGIGDDCSCGLEPEDPSPWIYDHMYTCLL